jgi:hypothetical protein
MAIHQAAARQVRLRKRKAYEAVTPLAPPSNEDVGMNLVKDTRKSVDHTIQAIDQLAQAIVRHLNPTEIGRLLHPDAEPVKLKWVPADSGSGRTMVRPPLSYGVAIFDTTAIDTAASTATRSCWRRRARIRPCRD